MASVPSSTEQYAFGRFRLTADASLLLDGDVAIPLAPKVLQTLRVLVERAGQVVTKDDLMRSVWRDTFVEETGLTRNISLLRRALGDEGERWIVTVPRVGYRFVAPVRLAAAPTTGASDDGAPFVGRAEELRRLREALDRCRRGHGTLIGLAGEPGLGKTTLAAHFVRTSCAGCLVGVGRSAELHGPVEPHLPVLEVLDELAASPAVARMLVQLAPTWAGHVRRTSAYAVPTAPPGTPERLLRELTQALAELGRERPVVVLLDDVHWADTATADAIAHLGPRLADMRVLVLLGYRTYTHMPADAPFTHVHDQLRARGLLLELPLPLLTREDVAQYVARAGPSATPADMADRVFARSEGNPLFMSALLTYLTEAGGAGLHAAVPAVPDSLRALIAGTLTRLGAAQRDVLDAAATQGLQFDLHVVAGALRQDALVIADVLDEIARVHGLVALETGCSSAVDRVSRFSFRHALYQSALLEEMAPSRRASLARQVADALLETQRDDPSVAGQAALLLDIAGADASAAAQFVVASRHAAGLLAFKDAYELALRGTRCLDRATDLAPDDRRRLALALTFAELVPLSSLRGYGHPAVEVLVQRASTLAGEQHDPAATAHALAMTCFVRLVRAQCTAARDAARQLVDVAAVAGNEALMVNAHMQAQIACHHLGEFRDADAHAHEVMHIGLRLRPHERFLNVFDPVVASLAESSRNAWITGRLAHAAVLAEHAVALGSDVGNPESLSFAWLFHAWLHGYRHDWRTCVQSADIGMAIARHAGAVQTLAWNTCVRGWGRAHQGEIEGGRQELADGMARSQAIMGEVALPQFRAMLAEVLLLRGALDEARVSLEDALVASEHQDDAYFASEIHRLAAVCDAPGPRGFTRDEHAARAIQIARLQGASFLELRAALTAHDLGGTAAAVESALARVSEPEPWPDVRTARERLS